MFRASHDDPDALNLLPEWREPVSSVRIVRAAVGSLVVHAAAVLVLLNLPASQIRTAPIISLDLRKAVPLIAPKHLDLTQRDPNTGKVTQTLDSRSALPPAPPKPRNFRPPAPPGPAISPAAPAPLIPEAPQIQTQIQGGPLSEIAGIAPSTPKVVEKPKIVFEDVGGPQRPLTPVPQSPLDDHARAGGLSAGLSGASPGQDDGSSAIPQLLSDPAGVDFKPYLLRVRAMVLRRWLAVVPESARRGRTGQVVVEVAIDRHGSVPDLKIATPSGILAFDRAAVAGINAASPFPPLPQDYKGDQIRLRLAFSYNPQPAAR
jgi:TonB family protein